MRDLHHRLRPDRPAGQRHQAGGSLQTFTYDKYGNLTGNGETAAAVSAMTYDLGDKLTKIDPTGTANDATFTFDALGRFWTRALASSTDTYSYAGTSETVLRISNSVGPTVTDSIVSPAGDRLAIKQGSTVNWLLPDPHGNVGASLDAAEAVVVNATRYDAYGMTIGTGTGGGTAVGQANWKYQGRLDVSPAGLATPLYDMSARFYSPGLGAFTQVDSVMGSAQNPISMNRFLYALANPATLIDPSGHKTCTGNNDDSCDHLSNDPAQSEKVKEKWKEKDKTKPPPKKDPEVDYVNKSKRPHWHVPNKGQASTGNHPNPAADAENLVLGGCSIVELNCTLDDINRMSFVERTAWLTQFEASYDTGGWISSLVGFVSAAGDAGISNTGWLSTVDARVIVNIQDGYVASITPGGVKSGSVGGVAEWAQFWTSTRADDPRTLDPDHLNRLAANAENASIAVGRAEAQILGRGATKGEVVGLLGANSFRLVQSNRSEIRTTLEGACAITPICGSLQSAMGGAPSHVFDTLISERNHPVGYWGARWAFSQDLNPGFPPVQFLEPFLP